jgi:hypothetical protein
MVPAVHRERLAKAKRLYRRRPSDGLGDLIDRVWNTCKEAAIDADAGRINDRELASFLESI